MTPERLELQEGVAREDCDLTAEQAFALDASEWVTVTRSLGGRWVVTPKSYVGAARIGDLDIIIRPKLPIRRLFFLLGYAAGKDRWDETPTTMATTDDLVDAMASAFVAQAERAIGQGLLQGYRTIEDALPVVRGRMRLADQMRRHYGMTLPVEVTYDEFDTDIAENQILKAAATVLLRLPMVRQDTRRRLARVHRSLADVSPLVRGSVLPHWSPTRLNVRYHVAVPLADLVVRSCSVEQTGDPTQRTTGFMINMATLFEDFLERALGEAIETRFGGRLEGQDGRWLDTGESVWVKPDLVWYPTGSSAAGAVIDAKYKAEKPSGYPNADLYQMLAYCTILGLDRGHLVYAKGHAEPGRKVVRNAGVTLVQHALDLDQNPKPLQDQVARLAATIAGMASRTPAF